MECPKCRQIMRWDAFTTARRPAALRTSDKRAPIKRAWHCRCGLWVYDPQGPPPVVNTPPPPAPLPLVGRRRRGACRGEHRASPRGNRPAVPRRFTLLDWPRPVQPRRDRH